MKCKFTFEWIYFLRWVAPSPCMVPGWKEKIRFHPLRLLNRLIWNGSSCLFAIFLAKLDDNDGCEMWLFHFIAIFYVFWWGRVKMWCWLLRMTKGDNDADDNFRWPFYAFHTSVCHATILALKYSFQKQTDWVIRRSRSLNFLKLLNGKWSQRRYDKRVFTAFI